jgi:hypothetical protein
MSQEIRGVGIPSGEAFGVEVSIQISHAAWTSWTRIAFEHERLAHKAWKARKIDEFLPGLVAITSSMFALDALSGSLGPSAGADRPADPRDENRGGRVFEVLKRSVAPAKLVLDADWSGRIRALSALRDGAVHFGERFEPPVWHERLKSNVGPEVIRWGAAAATVEVDLLVEVLETIIEHPHDRVRPWVDQYTPGVHSLLTMR